MLIKLFTLSFALVYCHHYIPGGFHGLLGFLLVWGSFIVGVGHLLFEFTLFRGQIFSGPFSLGVHFQDESRWGHFLGGITFRWVILLGDSFPRGQFLWLYLAPLPGGQGSLSLRGSSFGGTGGWALLFSPHSISLSLYSLGRRIFASCSHLRVVYAWLGRVGEGRAISCQQLLI